MDRAWGFQEVEAPRIQDYRHMKWLGCQLYAPAAFMPPPPPSEIFLERISVTGWVEPWSIKSMKNSKNPNRDFPSCSAGPQPTGPLRASTFMKSDGLFQLSKGTHVILLSPVWSTLVSSASKVHFNNIQQHGRCFPRYLFLSRKFLMHLSPYTPHILPSAESTV